MYSKLLKILAAFSITGLLVSTQSMGMMRDGCFALYQPGSSNGALCISGSMEEGIGGRGIRFMFYSSGSAVWCGTNSKLQVRWGKDQSSVAKYTFSAKSPIQSILMTWPSRATKQVEGRVRFNEGRKTDLQYMELSAQTIRGMEVSKAFQSPMCQKGLNQR